LSRKNRTLRFVEFTILFSLLVWLALHYRFEAEQVSPYWPSSAFLLAALYVFEKKDHIWALCLSYIADVVPTVIYGMGVIPSGYLALTSIGGTYLLYLYLQRTSPVLTTLSSTSSIVNFIVAAFVKTVLGASVGAYGIYLIYGTAVDSIDAIKIWTLAEWSGFLLLTPAFMNWLRLGFSKFNPANLSTRQLIEGVVVLLYFSLVVMFTQSGKGIQNDYLFKYLSIPGLVWALFRFKRQTNFYLLFGLYVLLNLSIVENAGEYAFKNEEFKDAILDLNLFLCVMGTVSLFILTSLRIQAISINELNAGREDLREIFENTPVPYIVLDGKGRAISWNEKFTEMLGTNDLSLKNKPFKEFLEPSSVARFEAMLYGTQPEFALKTNMITRHENFVRVVLRVKRSGSSNRQYYCSVENLSEKRNIEDAAKMAEERFRYLFNNSPEGILTVNSNDGTILESNGVAQKYLNLRFKTKQKIHRVLGLGEEQRTEIENKLKEGLQPELTVSLGNLDGSKIHLDLVIKRIISDEGGFDFYLFKDITGQRKNEKILRMNRLRLEAMLRIKENTSLSELELLVEVAEETRKVTFAKEAVIFQFTENEVLAAQRRNEISFSSRFTNEEFEKSDLRREWEPLFTSSAPLRAKRLDPTSKEGAGEFLMIFPSTEKHPFKLAIGVASDDDYDEGELDHFTLFSESIVALFVKVAADVENRNLSLAVQQSPASIVMTDLEGKIRYVNPKFEKTTGYTLEEVKGKTPRVIKSGETSPDVYKELWKTIKSGKPWKGIFHNRKKNGELYWESQTISPIKDNNGVITGFLAVKNDITLERQREEELHRREQRFSAIWNTSLDAMRLTDRNGVVVMVNKAYCQLIGEPEEKILGKVYSEYLEPDFHHDSLERYKQKFALGNIPAYQESLIHLRSGIKKWVDILSRMFEGDDGEPLLLSIFRDITTQKRREAELQDAIHKAEEMNRIKNTFLANMSHELRTPLINIMGYSEILADEIDDPTHHEMLESIQKGGERLRDTLESILDLSNIESDKFDTLVTVHNLNKTAEKVFKEYREAAKSKGLGFILELCDQTPTALIDEKFIYQVIDNLVNNALKYTDSGFVRISTEIVGSGGRKSSVVTVQDTGIGIKPENMQVIFEPFRQGDEGLGRQYEGAGIGLTVARKYVEIMGGELTVESNPNHGSVFRVSFVYTSEDQLEIDYQDADDKKLILIVEDDQTAANLMRMYLMQNYRTIVVMHSEEAMAVLGEQKVDLVIVDINLPGSENGIELRDKIKEIPLYHELPIIAITAYSLPGDQLRFKEIGFEAFLEKPFKREDFMNLVASLV